MTHSQLVIAEFEARRKGDIKEAERLQALRWEGAMGLVVNTENTRKPKENP